MDVGRAEERQHRLTDADASEAWRFDFAAADGSIAGWARHTRRGEGRSGRYEAFLAGAHRQLLVVVDDEVPPRSSPMEVRTTGLWADHVLETPVDHWTIGLEAFALGVDDPVEVYGAARGDRVPLGFDLEWEAEGPTLPVPGRAGTQQYELPCRVHGEVLVGNDSIEVSGVGWRSHAWGVLGWFGDDGWHLTGTGDGDLRWSIDCQQSRLVGVLIDAKGVVHDLSPEGGVLLDELGLPTGGWIESPLLGFEIEIVAVTPVLVADGDRRARRPAALARYRMATGGIGIGWIEIRGTSFASLTPIVKPPPRRIDRRVK